MSFDPVRFVITDLSLTGVTCITPYTCLVFKELHSYLLMNHLMQRLKYLVSSDRLNNISNWALEVKR
jgi:hypothetical protein